MSTNNNKTILITGANGNIGSYLSTHLQDYLRKEYNIILTDITQTSESKSSPSFIKADISNIDSLRKVFIKYKIDIVIHLAGKCSKNTPWKELLPNNIIGLYNVFEITAEFKCERIIFASSINAVNNYPEGKTIKTIDLPNPKSLYGATKVWGEAIAKLYSTERSLSAICIRFGRVVNKDDKRINSKNKSEEPFPASDRLIEFADATQLIAKCIEAPKSLKFFIAHGLSNNKKKRLEIGDTKRIIKYKPKYSF